MRSGRGARTDAERGAGTVLSLGLALVVILGVVACVLVAQGFAAAARASLTADLAALMAADTERGLRPGQACGVAEEVARLNNAELAACEVEHPAETVRVVVRVAAPAPLGAAEGRARAGPPR
ncbi:Rv3654c family TadE-like protein [Sinomonas sp. P47F7]|uniref:Rv3654c family TadE-like protein n=1 Tax=Sinomonas sp. P47F7 TaxID=3410987 RepID=UPI003BF601EB